MPVGQFLNDAIKKLMTAGIASARLDCLILLEDTLKSERSTILAHPEWILTDVQVNRLNIFIIQRIQHIPLAYIRGKVEFYGREFFVDEHVLIPRPETEDIISCLLEDVSMTAPTIGDIGTGSGCIGITAALEIPDAHVFLYDISMEALKIAAINKERHNADVQIKQQDLLRKCSEQFDILLVNLPYVSQLQPLNRAAAYEPPQAIYSGDDGLDHYRAFWRQIGDLTQLPGHIITESEPDQHETLTRLGKTYGYVCKRSEGFVQHFALKD